MLTILFLFLLFSFMIRMTVLSIRLTWGLSRILLRIIFLPLGLVLLAFGGLIRFGIILLIIAGIISFLERRMNRGL